MEACEDSHGGVAPLNSPVPRWAAPLAWPASILYRSVVAIRNARLNRVTGWAAPVPVIAVGNLTAGGTGKSPMVRWICQSLRDAGRTPAIVLRGHHGGERSDEVLEHREVLPDVTVGVGPNRREVIERLLHEHAEIDAIVFDDGFQHRHVARDLDVVLVDASRPSLHDALLPMGWLREPATSLARAGAVVVTRAEHVDEQLSNDIQRLHGAPPCAWTKHRWSGVRLHSQGVDTSEPVAWLRGKRVAMWAGIGNPEAFQKQLRESGAVVCHAPRLRDHQSYSPSLIASLMHQARSHGCEAVVCTMKDWVKIQDRMPKESLPIACVMIELAFLQGADAFATALKSALRVGDSRRLR